MALLASVIIWYLPKDLGPSLTALAGLPHSAKDMRQRYQPRLSTTPATPSTAADFMSWRLRQACWLEGCEARVEISAMLTARRW